VQVGVFLSRYRGYQRARAGGGSRLRRVARGVLVGGLSIDAVSAMTVAEAERFFEGLTLGEKDAAVAAKVLSEIRKRLRFLRDVGLDYLTLDRLSSTLSGGEAQRINLATALGSALVGTLYVLDEPSIGLHPRDTGRLIAILQQLRDQGNTVIVVEHDADMIRVADHVVDLGPGAGEQGGRVVYSGSLDGLAADARSLTARYLRGELAIPLPPVRQRGNGRRLRVVGASAHNLRNLDIEIPLGTLTCVTGVSGSGKSTLVHDIIYPAIKRLKGNPERKVGAHRRIEGVEAIGDAVLVDQAPIGRTPRSNPVTYLKAFDPIREAFASTKDARVAGLTASDFSFNVPGGRCEACEGEGQVRVEMQFLADVFVPCEVCDGRRFKPQVLEVKYRGRNVHQVLEMTVHEALTFFAGATRVLRRLRVLDEIGLGYLRLGPPARSQQEPHPFSFDARWRRYGPPLFACEIPLKVGDSRRGVRAVLRGNVDHPCRPCLPPGQLIGPHQAGGVFVAVSEHHHHLCTLCKCLYQVALRRRERAETVKCRRPRLEAGHSYRLAHAVRTVGQAQGGRLRDVRGRDLP
jgi:excinuclease ABC subunit A